MKDRYLGKGVTKAVGAIENTLAEELKGLDSTDQALVDRTMIELDDTPNKSNFGANALLADRGAEPVDWSTP